MSLATGRQATALGLAAGRLRHGRRPGALRGFTQFVACRIELPGRILRPTALVHIIFTVRDFRAPRLYLELPC
ncbi:MAG TPA: hypothetical protein VGG64_16645 [Pirellulales bacterium]